MNFYFFMLKINPNTTPKKAAKSTWKSAGNRKVMVCAGYQKSGMVFLKTKPHCTSQLILCAMMSPMGMGLKKRIKEPPVS